MKRYLALILAVIMMITLVGCRVSDEWIAQDSPSVTQNVPGTEEENKTPEPEPIESSLEIHYIDVGQADAALVLCGDKTMLIDGGNATDSSLIYTYLKNKNVSHIDCIICSHPHEDHIGGLPAALTNFDVGMVYAPSVEADSNVYNTFVNKVSEKGLTIQEPTPGTELVLGDAKVAFLGPINPTDDLNNASVILKITHGKNSFLFTGDAEREAEQDVLDAGYDLSATVLKVGHHGSANSTTYPFLREIMPEYAVISVGKGNSYGHPTEETLSRLRDADIKVYRTDMQDDIIAVSDGETVSITTQKNADTETNPTVVVLDEPEPQQPSGITYIGNRKSKKFHLPSCYSLPAEHNRVYFDFRSEATSRGYSSCGNCQP